MIFTVAIDGPAAAGKGTISKAVAAFFGMAHLDTGLLYRAVGLKVLNGGDPLASARSICFEDLHNSNLRVPEVAEAASKVAGIVEVRAELLAFQKSFARREGGAVLDGRDIGTVICPDAEAKLFVTASAKVRASRRCQELHQNGMNISAEQVLKDLLARDARDTDRGTAPMIQAVDSILIDTSQLTVDDAIAEAVAVVKKRISL
ncbi:(d)CMP kinase [bacterium]|nr:(d)CMP kinase [bacterium]